MFHIKNESGIITDEKIIKFSLDWTTETIMISEIYFKSTQ